MIKFFKNQKGFGILESVVALGLLGAGIYIVFEGIDMISEMKTSANEQMDLEVILSSSMEQVRSNIANEKIDFKAYDNFLNLSSYADVKESLKMRWNKQGIQTIAACTLCKGRMGYVVVPYKVGNLTFKGLYEVVIRVTHDELFPNRFREYRYIVRGQ